MPTTSTRCLNNFVEHEDDLKVIGNKEKIKDAKKGSKHTVHVRRAMYPEMEN